ncbi:MAG: chondroitin AC lyase [Gammaproteobacteria bacterium]|nr:MAG: chondroitin AC lyase [Gammaproteobacteria bacterium]
MRILTVSSGKMKAIKLKLCILCCLLLTSEVFSQSAAEVVIGRHKEFLVRNRAAVSVDSIVKHYDDQRRQWVNIDYNDQQRAGWRLAEHLNNVLYLGLAFVDQDSEHFKEQKLKSILEGALQNWLDKRYKSSNWWHNEIGIPAIMRDIVVVLKNELSPLQLDGCLSVIAQHSVKGTGANLTWSGDVGLFYGLLTGEYKKVKEYARLLQNEVRISDGEGLKPDFSFHQHKERLQMYQYGAAFLLTNTRLAWVLRDTEWQYDAEKIDLLLGMLLNGWQWMARGMHTVPGTMDRSITRKNATKAADVTLYIPMLIDLKPGERSALQTLYKSQVGSRKILKGFKYFPYSDMAAYHTPDFSFFLKTISTRTLSTESINRENLKGRLLNSGDHYIVRSGNEYANMMPVWDWQRLPGITAFADAAVIDKKDFAGSVTNGSSGLTAMEYSLRDSQSTKSLTAKKLWVNHKNYLVCLVTDINMHNVETAYTTLDQSRFLTDIFIDNRKVGFGKYEIKEGEYVYQNEIVYKALFNDKMHLFSGPVSGSWYSINNSYADQKVVENVFMPYIDHHPGQGQAGYLIAYAKNKKKAEKINAGKDIVVLANDSSKQVIAIGKKNYFGAFYSQASFTAKGIHFSVDRPCLVIISGNKLSISDPARKGGAVNLTYNGKRFEIVLLPDGTTTTIKL